MRTKLAPLTSPWFVACLFVLLINDFFLKSSFPGWITGKLSDFAGLFVFVVFWTAIFPKSKAWVHVVTMLTFIWWKSPFSEPFIDFIRVVDRTVDMTDLVALAVLPVVYFLRHEKKLKLNPIALGIITIFSFCATSAPRERITFDFPQYLLFRSSDIRFDDSYRNDIVVHHFDSVTDIIRVNSIGPEYRPVLVDGLTKAQVLAGLDTLIKGEPFAINFKSTIALNLDSTREVLTFTGSRLHGSYKKYSKNGQLLAEGQYNNGIEDSVWTFYTKEGRKRVRKHVVAGEVTKVESFGDDKVAVTEFPKTRADAIDKQYTLLAVFGLLMITCTGFLIRNFRSSEKEDFIKMSPFSMIAQIAILPTFVVILAKIISNFVSDAYYDMFTIPVQLVVANLIMIPLLIVIHYGLKLRSRYDLALYVILFTAGFLFIQEFGFLRQILP